MWLLWASLGWADEWPRDADILEALAVQSGEDGLNALSDLLPAVVPADPFPVDDTGASSSCWYMYQVSNLWVQMEVEDALLVPLDGSLGIDMDLIVAVNDSSDPFTLAYELLCLGDEVCPGWVNPFPMNVKAPVTLGVATHTDGKPILTATVGDLILDSSLDSSYTQLQCTTGTIENILGFFGLNLYDLLLDLAAGQLKKELQKQIDDAIVQVRYEDEIDMLGTPLSLAIYPYSAEVTADGLEVVMMGHAEAPPHECVAAYDTGGSPRTDSPVPDVLDLPPTAHLAALAADDFVNQLLYAVWSGGALCYTIDETMDLGGFAVDTSLLSLVGGEAYDDLVPETPTPLVIRTDPRTPLAVNPVGEHALDVAVRDLHLNFFSELDGRTARTLALSVDADLGVDLELDATTGALGIVLDLGPEAFHATVADDVMVKGHEAEVEEGFGEVMSGLLDTLLSTLLGDALSFPLPAMGGMGLTSLSVEAAGDSEDWVGMYAQVGPVTYGDPEGGCGCDGEGGGCAEGCDSGSSSCSTSGGPAVPCLFALVTVLRRRRPLLRPAA